MRFILFFVLFFTAVLQAKSYFIYEDKERNASIEYITKHADSLFIPTENTYRGFSDSIWWLKVDLENSTQILQNYSIVFKFPLLLNVQAYHLLNKEQKVDIDGRNEAFTPTDTTHSSAVFNYPVQPHSKQSIFIRIENDYLTFLDYEVMNSFELNRLVTRHAMEDTFFAIVLITLVLYNLFILFVTRDRVYLYYVLFMIGGFFASMGTLNFFRTYFDIAIDSLYANFYGGVLFSISAALFLIELFKSTVSKLDRMIAWFVIGIVIIIVLISIYDITLAMKVYALYGLGVLITGGLTGILLNALIKGHPLAKIVSIGWGIFLLSLVFYILSFYALLGPEYNSVFKYGLVAEGLIFSMVLGYRLKTMEEYRDQARLQALENEKKLNAQIEASRSLFQQLYDSIDAIVAVIEKDGTMSMINKYGEELTGYSAKEISSEPYFWFDHFIPATIRPDIMEIIQSMKSSGTLISKKVNPWVDKDGNTHMIQWSNSLIKDKNQDAAIVTVGIDITDKVEAERIAKENQRLIDEKTLAEKSNQAKSAFLANMSHEIRTPMNGLLGFIERLQKSEKDPERIKLFKTISNSGETLLNIINDILDFSKIEIGKMQLDLAPIYFTQTIEHVIDSFTQLASAKNITMHHTIDDTIPECIMGDETRFKQVLFNLINNAIKFTEENGHISLHISYKKDSRQLYVAVIDTGIGIAQENLQKIFDSFSQEDVSTTRKYGGTGLGLSISSQLVKLMGGELQVQSKVSEGSTFYFEIPVETCSLDDLEIQEETPQNEPEQDIRLKGHVLIVEDNKTNQILLSLILDDFGLSYDVVNNGSEAVLNVKQYQYDLVLMDQNMPIMNGIEATQIIRDNEKETQQHLPIIAVTANALVEDRQKLLDAGMDDYISKPYTEDQILEVLLKHLP